MKSTWCVVAVLVSLAVVACSNTPTESGANGTADSGTASDANTNSGSGDAGADAAQDAATSCTTGTNGGSVISETAGVGEIPTPAGGTITDGTYVLTKHEVYPPGSPDENTRKRTMIFSGDSIQVIEDDPGRSPVRAAGTYTIDGSTLNVTITCPVADSATLSFTATATTFQTIGEEDVFTYTKQ
ncbi:MAG TPA: hypothetical protein VM580_02625 [Labilithrix sp.]|nr:hypothetical protein [Labilithrix sp.]